MSGSRRAWAVRGLGLVTFTSLVGASTGVTGTGGITGKAVITQSGTFTVTQNIDLSGTNLGAGVPVISIALSGGQATLDLDDHVVKRGPGGPVIELVCGAGGGQVVIKDGKVESGSENIRSTNCDVRLEGIVAAGANQDGVHVTGGSLAVVSSTVRGSGRNGIWGDSSTCGVDDSSIIAPGVDGLALQEATQVVLTGTVIRGAGRHGVNIIEEIPIPSFTASFTDVRILGSAGDGYHVDGDVPLTISGGLVRGSGGNGIFSAGNHESIAITSAKITDTAGPAAIALAGRAGNAVIRGNQIRGFAGDGIADLGSTLSSSLRVEDNVLSLGAIGEGSSDTIALRIQSSDTEGIQSSDTEGIVGHEDGTSLVAGNTIEGGSTGMWVQASGAVIARNTVRMVQNGIAIAGDATVVRDNVVAGRATGTGIWTADGGDLLGVYRLIEGNRVRNFATGLSFTAGPALDASAYYRGNTIVGNTTAVVGGHDAGNNILF